MRGHAICIRPEKIVSTSSNNKYIYYVSELEWGSDKFTAKPVCDVWVNMSKNMNVCFAID